jgi:hypothetical protein
VGSDPPEDLRPSPAALDYEVVYATDGAQLYQLDVLSRTFTALPPLVGCTFSVVELAMSDRSGLYAAGQSAGKAALYQIDPRTGRCTLAASFDAAAPLALSFVPSTDAAGEALVAYGSGSLVRFDAMLGWSGAVPSIPMAPRSCAMVSLPGGPTLVSMVEHDGTAAAANVIAEVDPRTGQTLDVRGTIPGPRVLEGLAIGGMALYGFSDRGEVLRLSFGSGKVDVVPIPTTGGPARFTGAASARFLPGTPH